MQLDKNYTFSLVCPDTGKSVREHQHKNKSKGSCIVCHHCGDDSGYNTTHAIRSAGKWNRPSIIEWLGGKRKQYIRIDDIISDQALSVNYLDEPK